MSDAEIAKLKCKNVKILRANGEYNEKRDAENAKLKARIEELESENVEFSDRLMKVEQNQLLIDNTSIDNTYTFNNNSYNFNSDVDYHEKSLQEKEIDNFL